MLPPTIPIFPLPNVVLFPNAYLPLHIFEPRYRAMVADALAGDRIIGMVLLRPGWEGHYEGRPDVYTIGTAGLITFSEPYADGRYNIVLRGLHKFSIRGEDRSRSYRIAHIDPVVEELTDADQPVVQAERQRLEALLMPRPTGRGVEPNAPPAMADADLVNALAQYLDLQPVEKQALLECEGIVDRCRSLIDLLEMKAISPPNGWDSSAH